MKKIVPITRVWDISVMVNLIYGTNSREVDACFPELTWKSLFSIHLRWTLIRALPIWAWTQVDSNSWRQLTDERGWSQLHGLRKIYKLLYHYRKTGNYVLFLSNALQFFPLYFKLFLKVYLIRCHSYKNIYCWWSSLWWFSLGNIAHPYLLPFSVSLKPHTNFLIIFLGIWILNFLRRASELQNSYQVMTKYGKGPWYWD